MEKDSYKKWAKAFLLFLAFVWLCTVISKSIYVAGLPVVKTDTASKRYVEHVVEAEGIVVSGGEIAINALAGLRVDKIEYNLSDTWVNSVIDAQKREVAILWAQEDYETADRETATAKERAKEAVDAVQEELARHTAKNVPYTSDNDRREAWDKDKTWIWNFGHDNGKAFFNPPGTVK